MRNKITNNAAGITEEAEPSEGKKLAPDSTETVGEASDNDTEEIKKSEETGRSEDTDNSEELSPEKTNGKSREKRRQPQKPVSTKRLAVSLLIKAAAVILVIWITFTFILGITINQGNNMHPAINDGDLVISLRLQQPYLNAAVLYSRNGKTAVGRVVGLPGNVIDISENGRLLVDGTAAAEDIVYPTQKAEDSDIRFPYTVEDGKAFILNDYRTDTDDSRSFGAADMKDIYGPVLLILRRRGF